MNLIDMLDQPAVVTAIAGFFAWLVARMFARRPDWRKYEGLMISAVKMAEKIIFDDTANTAAARADAALKQFIAQYHQVYGTMPDDATLVKVSANMPLVHDALDAEGTLKGSAQ